MINGAALASSELAHTQWLPDGPGFVTATVIDASGNHDRVSFRVAAFVGGSAVDGSLAAAGELHGTATVAAH